MDNDIAILKLCNEVELSHQIQIACLPDPKYSNEVYPSEIGLRVYAVGFGVLQENQETFTSMLNNVLLKTYKSDVCSDIYMTDNQICIGS
jgi:hypothetical protein